MFENFIKLSGNVAASSGFIYGFSEEHKNFYSSGYRCSQCGKTLFNVMLGVTINCYSKDGAKIPSMVGVYRGEIAECPNCNHRWNMRGDSNLTKPNALEFLSIIETHRSEEFLGKEQRLIDNSKSTSKTTRKITAGREWSKSYSIQYEKTQVNGTELNLGLKFPEIEVASIKLTSQETLKKQYSVSEGTKENYIDEVVVEVLGSTKVNLIFSWKRIWQNGFIKLCAKDKTEFNVPFQVVVGVTFDEFLVEES